jgi:hypothetical protein
MFPTDRAIRHPRHGLAAMAAGPGSGLPVEQWHFPLLRSIRHERLLLQRLGVLKTRRIAHGAPPTRRDFIFLDINSASLPYLYRAWHRLSGGGRLKARQRLPPPRLGAFIPAQRTAARSRPSVGASVLPCAVPRSPRALWSSRISRPRRSWRRDGQDRAPALPRRGRGT